METILVAIIFLLLGAGLVVIGQFSISSGLLGRRNQTPPKTKPTAP
jgi:hypothetical protein